MQIAAPDGRPARASQRCPIRRQRRRARVVDVRGVLAEVLPVEARPLRTLGMSSSRFWSRAPSLPCQTENVDSHIRRGRNAVTRAVSDGGRSRPVPDQAVRTAAGPEHGADTMSSHDTAALDADQEEQSAYVVTAGRHEPAELVLGRLEARMTERGLRAHVYLTERTVVEFATRRNRTDRPLERNVGPEPVRRVLAELLRPETEPRSWLTRLHAVAAGRSRVPAPTLWNSPALVVTGALASRVLCAAIEHEPDLSSRDHRLSDAGGGRERRGSRFDVRGGDRQAADA